MIRTTILTLLAALLLTPAVALAGTPEKAIDMTALIKQIEHQESTISVVSAELKWLRGVEEQHIEQHGNVNPLYAGKATHASMKIGMAQKKQINLCKRFVSNFIPTQGGAETPFSRMNQHCQEFIGFELRFSRKYATFIASCQVNLALPVPKGQTAVQKRILTNCKQMLLALGQPLE